jgi:hypothetical protein
LGRVTPSDSFPLQGGGECDPPPVGVHKMKCPVCKKTLQKLQKRPPWAYSPGNYRQRQKDEQERLKQSMLAYTEVRTAYDDVLGVPHKETPYYMHNECADAYFATVRLLRSTGELKSRAEILAEQLLEFSNQRAIKMMNNGIFGKIANSSFNSIVNIGMFPEQPPLNDTVDALAYVTYAQNTHRLHGSSGSVIMIDDVETESTPEDRAKVKKWYDDVLTKRRAQVLSTNHDFLKGTIDFEIKIDHDKNWDTNNADIIKNIKDALEKLRGM